MDVDQNLIDIIMSAVDSQKYMNFCAIMISDMDPEWLFHFFDTTPYDIFYHVL